MHIRHLDPPGGGPLKRTAIAARSHTRLHFVHRLKDRENIDFWEGFSCLGHLDPEPEFEERTADLLDTRALLLERTALLEQFLKKGGSGA